MCFFNGLVIFDFYTAKGAQKEWEFVPLYRAIYALNALSRIRTKESWLIKIIPGKELLALTFSS